MLLSVHGQGHQFRMLLYDSMEEHVFSELFKYDRACATFQGILLHALQLCVWLLFPNPLQMYLTNTQLTLTIQSVFFRKGELQVFCMGAITQNGRLFSVR